MHREFDAPGSDFSETRNYLADLTTAPAPPSSVILAQLKLMIVAFTVTPTTREQSHHYWKKVFHRNTNRRWSNALENPITQGFQARSIPDTFAIWVIAETGRGGGLKWRTSVEGVRGLFKDMPTTRRTRLERNNDSRLSGSDFQLPPSGSSTRNLRICKREGRRYTYVLGLLAKAGNPKILCCC